MRERLSVLWRHYSSWFLIAITALGGLQQAGVQIEGLPKWAITALAFCALGAKLIPQEPSAPKAPGVSPYQNEGPGS